ncbi:MAG TPA: FAD:protein FMN transferase [Vagococcus sp.]|nr:FAD:protein FMN transferase [Vagococcus sp.]
MGTTIKLKVQAENAHHILQVAENMLIDFEQRFNANDENSQLMKLAKNAGEKVTVLDQDLYELIKIGKRHSDDPDSFLNITLGPLIKAWNIGFLDAQMPKQEIITEKLQLSNPKKILLDDAKQSVLLKEKGMSIDLGALAKGYFADKIIHFFKQEGAVSGFIDLGGNVLTFGEASHTGDDFWKVGIQNPFLPRGNQAMILKIKNQSVVTSGIYERVLVDNDQKYHHIFDRKTGYPVATDLVSLTIVSKLSLDGEIWTTRLFGHNISKILETVSQDDSLEAILMTKNGELAYTKGIKNRLV